MLEAITDNLAELADGWELKGGLSLFFVLLQKSVGMPDSAAGMLFALLAADLFLGIARALKTDTFDGRKIIKGAWKFFRYWMAIAVFVMTDDCLAKAFTAIDIPLSDAFIAYLAINEAFSCLDHLAFFNIPVPPVFLRKLRRYRREIEHNGDEPKDKERPSHHGE